MLGVSQQVYANLLGRSGAAVRAWELSNSGKEPDGAAARLLEIFERHPEIAEELMKPLGASKAVDRAPDERLRSSISRLRRPGDG